MDCFLQNYSDFIKNKFDEEYIKFAKNLGIKIANLGLIISLILFVIWALMIGKVFNIFAILIYLNFIALIMLIKSQKHSYTSSSLFVVLILFVSIFREYLRYEIMSNLGYDIYEYPVDLEWPSVIMFLLTLLSLGGVGISFIATIAWKVGKSNGYFDASKDKTVSRLASATVLILVIWCIVYFAWGFFVLFRNTL